MCVMCYVHDGGEGRVLTCCLQCVRVYLCVRVCVYCVYCVCESMCVLYAGGLRSGCSPAACSVYIVVCVRACDYVCCVHEGG